MTRRRRPHLVAHADAGLTLCNLPTYRRCYVLVSDIISINTCDACLLQFYKNEERKRG